MYHEFILWLVNCIVDIIKEENWNEVPPWSIPLKIPPKWPITKHTLVRITKTDFLGGYFFFLLGPEVSYHASRRATVRNPWAIPDSYSNILLPLLLFTLCINDMPTQFGSDDEINIGNAPLNAILYDQYTTFFWPSKTRVRGLKNAPLWRKIASNILLNPTENRRPYDESVLLHTTSNTVRRH